MILTTVNVPDCVPDRLKKQLELLTGEVQDLHCARCLFWDLCIEAPENVKLIRRTAPYFFKRLQSILLEHLILVARLTDPPSTGKNRNLGLADLFLGTKPPQIAALATESADMREIRNKIVAHLDWKVGLDPSTLPGDKIFRKIRTCTKLMAEVIDSVWQQWADGGYTMPNSDAMEITNCLGKALAYDQLEQEGVVVENFWSAPEDMKQEFLGKCRAKLV